MIKRYFIPHKGNAYHPHFFRNTALGFVVAFTVILVSASLTGSLILENKNLLGAIYASVLVELTNKDRTSSNLPTLSVNEALTKAAELKAQDMITSGYFAHNSPDGKTPWTWMIQSGYKFVYAGENLAVKFTESEQVESAWMGSPTHRANILNNKFTEVGIAVKEGQFQGENAVFVVQMFGKPTKTKTAVSIPKPESIAPKATTSPVVATSFPTNSQVKGAEFEITTENTDTASNNLFIAAKDPIAEKESISDTNPAQTIETKITSNISNRIVMKFPLVLNMVYAILGIFVLFGIVMLIAVEIRHRKPKLIIIGLVLLLVLASAMYMNSSTTLYTLASTLY